MSATKPLWLAMPLPVSAKCRRRAKLNPRDQRASHEGLSKGITVSAVPRRNNCKTFKTADKFQHNFKLFFTRYACICARDRTGCGLNRLIYKAFCLPYNNRSIFDGSGWPAQSVPHAIAVSLCIDCYVELKASVDAIACRSMPIAAPNLRLRGDLKAGRYDLAQAQADT